MFRLVLNYCITLEAWIPVVILYMLMDEGEGPAPTVV